MGASRRPRRLVIEFLLLTVPVIGISALLFFAALIWFKSEELHELNLEIEQQQARRNARMLSTAMWNLDQTVIGNIVEQLTSADQQCVIASDALNVMPPVQGGRCDALVGRVRIEVPIESDKDGESRAIGTYQTWVDPRVSSSTLIAALRPLSALLLLLVVVLVGCVLIAFRRTILRPLAQVMTSIRTYRNEGRRVPVGWHSANELGEFVREYNAGLQRQAEAEQRLTEQLNFQLALRNTLPTPFAFIDRDTRVFNANPAFYRLFDLHGEDSPPLGDLLPRADWDAIRSLSRDAVHSEELLVDDPRGDLILHIDASPFLDADGQTRGYVLALRDITAQIRSEQALETAKADAENTLQSLRYAQANLVQAEKLASLGGLVAGIAHEINTPLGNSITVATTLTERVRQFEQHLEAGTLRKSVLQEFLADNKEACDILHRALEAAADQVRKFKQVAVDQTASHRRGFDLLLTVEEVLSTLRPRIKHSRHRVEVDIEPGIVLDSYPGPLGQVITNCFTNALMHAFDGIEAGVFRIVGRHVGMDQVRVEFIDTGRGIAPDHLSRVFDPFFTTKLGAGGSGLGMSLVQNLVSSVLGGTVTIASEVGHGTTITVDIPRVAPREARPRSSGGEPAPSTQQPSTTA